jgi:hypothetical protein
MTMTTGAPSAGAATLSIHDLGPSAAAISTEQRRRVLTDLAEHVHADRGAAKPIYDDDVLLTLVPPWCGDIDPSVAVALFLLMAEEQADQARADASYAQIDIAERNAGHYLEALVGVRP